MGLDSHTQEVQTCAQPVLNSYNKNPFWTNQSRSQTHVFADSFWGLTAGTLYISVEWADSPGLGTFVEEEPIHLEVQLGDISTYM